MRVASAGGAETGEREERGQVFRMDARISTPPGGHAAVYDAAMWPFERAAVGGWRRRLAGARTRARAGDRHRHRRQLRWYAPGTEVTALEPDASMRGAGAAAGGARRRERDGRRRPRRGVAVRGRELRRRRERVRALHGGRPGGGARRAPPGAGPRRGAPAARARASPLAAGAGLQSRAAPAWAAVAGGCRLDRDTGRFAREAGFYVLQRVHARGRLDRRSRACAAPSGCRPAPALLDSAPRTNNEALRRAPTFRSPPSTSPLRGVRMRAQRGPSARPPLGTGLRPLPAGESRRKDVVSRSQSWIADRRDRHRRRHRARHRRRSAEGRAATSVKGKLRSPSCALRHRPRPPEGRRSRALRSRLRDAGLTSRSRPRRRRRHHATPRSNS